MADSAEGAVALAQAHMFSVEKQRLELDFSFCPRHVKGKTTIVTQPQSSKIREIHLNCRQLKPTHITVDGRPAVFNYSNLYDRLQLYPGTGIEQHHFARERIQRHEAGEEDELIVFVPDKLRIRETPETGCAMLTVEIMYTLDDFRDGLHFAGVEDGDARYPHVYTRNSPFAGMASSLFPCVDDGATRCSFEVSVRYPRTVGDALARHSGPSSRPQTNGITRKADSVMSDSDEDPNGLSEEESALEMSVICSGVLTDDIVDPADPTRMTASFSIDPPGGVLPQHVGIVIGPFQHVDLSDYRDTSDDSRLGKEAIKVHAFCLPGKEDEARNSALMLARTLDNFTERYQTYRFGQSYKIAFVDDLDCDTAHTASLSICSSRLLFPETVWEPLEHTTRVLIHAVASQWIGVDVIAESPKDYWVIVGGSWFMTELYLRELFGRNDHRFRQKLMVDKIMTMDIRRPSLVDLGQYLQLDPGELEFMELKALSVLSILHNRLVKQSGKNGVDRCLYRLLFNRGDDKLKNGAISTSGFLEICEKVGHQKLENFFKQWVYGSGCPTFECFPQFNKKKQVIQLSIRQTQADPSLTQDDRLLGQQDFMREAKEQQRGFSPGHVDWPAFVGPMTIRIHEADGTPYEHIVDINSSNVKVEIPYNTKYKRLKRNRLNKERQAAAQGIDATGETQDDVTFYSLGDMFQTAEEGAEWRIADWPEDDERRMENEAYEWLRVDADFEWICRANINDMPSYMYVSQLQQDKDVVAQAESIQYLALKEGHRLISSFLVKTLMDNRYFHGIRTMAAEVLAASAKDYTNMIGLFHLKKAFQELFCIPGSPMTRSNDFSDRSSYLIQCAIPKAIAKIKRADGKAPMEVKRFLLDVMRYNDNRGNDYSDDHYLATLMQCLAESLTTAKPSSFDRDPTLSLVEEAEEFDFARKAIEELDRHRRLDEWIPTYQNVYTTTALDCAVKLMKSHITPIKMSEFLQYTQFGNGDNVRLKAWECLIDLGVFIKNDGVLKYMIHEIHSDPSPYVRAQLLRIFDLAVGQVALGEVYKPENLNEKANGGLVVEEESGTMMDRQANLARKELKGARAALKADLENNHTLRESLEVALRSKSMSLRDVAELLDFISMVFEADDSLEITLKYPRYWKVRHEGAGRLRFYHSDRIRTQPLHPVQSAARAPSIVEPAAVAPPKFKLKLKSDGLKQAAPSAPTPPPPAPSKSVPEPMEDVLPTPSIAVPPASMPPPLIQKSPSPAPPIPTKGLSPVLSAPTPSVPPRRTPTPTPAAESPIVAPPPTTPPTLPTVAPAASEPTAVPTPAPAPAPVSAPKQSIKLKAPSAKSSAKAPKAPRPAATPKSKGKKSRIVTLKLPPDVLANLEANSKKRKADGELAVERPTKRQSTEPAMSNGAGHRVSIERMGGPNPRLLLKLKVGKGGLPKE